MTRVIYIGGWGRSGSTLLDRVLGQIPGFASLGEVRELWQRGLAEDRPCGCGEPFRRCPFWTEVGREAFGGWERLDLDRVLGYRYSLDRPWTPAILAVPRGPSRLARQMGEYLEILERLYGAIERVSGATVVVDSSKLPSHAMLLRRVPRIDLRIVHLIRDSRGVAFSWQKQVASAVASGEVKYLERYSPVAASARYVMYNGLTRAMAWAGVPYLRLRYEDFVAAPRAALGRVLSLAGDDPALRNGDLAFLRDREVELRPNHTVDGNPMRFAVGSVRLRVDDEWRLGMSASDRRAVTALTSPMLLAYGYPLGSGPRGGSA